MNIAVVKKITNTTINKFIQDKIDTAVYCQFSDDVDYNLLSKQFKLISAYDDATNATWFGFELMAKKISLLRQKNPNLFNYKGIDIEEAIKKDIFWSFLMDNSLLYQVEKIKSKENKIIFYDKRSSFRQKVSLLKHTFSNISNAYSINVPDYTQERTQKIAFRINNLAGVHIYGNLLKELRKENVISFQSKISKSKHNEIEMHNQFFSENITAFSAKKKIHIPFFTKLKLLFSPLDTEFLITFLINCRNLYNHVDEYDRLFKSGIKKIVLNAGENEGEGNIVCALAKKYNAKTFNYMNGAKAYSPHNVNTFFDYWFMPDKKTQELILSYCNVSENQVPVTGHLLQEIAKKHVYMGTLDKYFKNIEHKKIIALFTSPIFSTEIKNVLDFLVSYIEKRSDIVVLIRKHPSETQAYNLSHNKIIEMEKNSEELSQINLFDLLLKSDAAISFSSTVSWQASWFGTPSINYEVSEKSRLTFVDDESVININNIEKLRKYLDTYLYKTGIKNKRRKEENVASHKIASIILNS